MIQNKMIRQAGQVAWTASDHRAVRRTTTPSWSAIIQSPGFTSVGGNALSSPTSSCVIRNGTLTADGRVKGDCPTVECPRAKTGNRALRCSERSLHRPEMTTPNAPRACAPAVMSPPHTAFFASVRQGDCFSGGTTDITGRETLNGEVRQ